MANDTYKHYEGGQSKMYKNVYEEYNSGGDKSYAHYIKSFILGDYYYIPPSYPYAVCTADESKYPKIDKEYDYLRNAIESMKLNKD